MTHKNSLPPRIRALRRFALSITAFNVLGHTIFGFEQAWSHPLLALLLAYTLELLFEWLFSRQIGRSPRFTGQGWVGLVDFLLPAHISALAIAMLLYPNGRVAPILFAVVVCMTSKVLFRIPINGRSRHFLNPSNFGIAMTLVLFPWVGIAPPYHFTENLTGVLDWIVPLFIVVSGAMLNAQLTRKMPLILTWLGAFVLQAVVRAAFFDISLTSALLPLSGVAFLLFTFYMISDPGTTPFDRRGQIAFGATTAVVYGVLVSVHIVFGLFFALVLTSAGRGVLVLARQQWAQRHARRYAQPISTSAGLSQD